MANPLSKNKRVMNPRVGGGNFAPVLADGTRSKDAKGEWQPLFDRSIIVDATAYSEINFFQQGHRNGRGWEDTNVTQPGQLPGRTTFSVRGVAVKITPIADTDWNMADLLAFNYGLFTLYRGDSALLRLPMGAVTGGYGGFTGPSSGALPVSANLGNPSTNDYWRVPHVDYAMPLIAEGSFHVSLTWAAAWTAAEDWKVYVYLIGDRVLPLDQS